MKAMILCAGLGTRLRPWTLSHPKALVPVGGVPMLKRVADRLVGLGFDSLTLNVHHFAGQIVEYVGSGALGAADVSISDESECLLDTGGGILNAERLLSADGQPFLVHNVDILSDADLAALYRRHIESGADVTLLVSDRDSDRRLVFDSDMRLIGWHNRKTGETRPSVFEMMDSDISLSFSGIYVMSPSVFDAMRRLGFSGSFPIMEFFLKAASEIDIRGFRCDNLTIIDIGKPETLDRANRLQ